MDYSHKAQEKGMVSLYKYSNQCLFFCQYKIKYHKRKPISFITRLFYKDTIRNVIERKNIVSAGVVVYNREK